MPDRRIVEKKREDKGDKRREGNRVEGRREEKKKKVMKDKKRIGERGEKDR
jgi:hypothetical protein